MTEPLIEFPTRCPKCGGVRIVDVTCHGGPKAWLCLTCGAHGGLKPVSFTVEWDPNAC